MNNTYELLCQYINWQKATDYDTIMLNMSQDFSRDEIREAYDYARSLMGKLREAGIEDMIAEHNGYYGDSVHDLMCELVAHGEEYVESVLDNPGIALNRFREDDYTENFFYCFPGTDGDLSHYDENGDFKLLTARYYWKGVCEIRKHLRNSLHGTPEEGVTRYDSNFNKIEDKITHEQVKLIADILDEIWHLKWNSNRDYNTIYRNTEGLGQGAIVANLWNDFGKNWAKVHPDCVIGDGKYRKYPENSEI